MSKGKSYMNIQHLRYMVEVERVGSITKAASNLFMGQPNLSKAIKEIENEIGIEIFKRSAKGVFPTEKGAEFLDYAKNILVQMEKIESLYLKENSHTMQFGASVPRATYITQAFTTFINSIDPTQRFAVDFRETNSVDAVNNVCDGTSNLAVIRYDIDNEEYFMSLLEEKELKYEPVLKFDYRVLISAKHPLAGCEVIASEQLSELIEVVHGDYEVPYLSSVYTKKYADAHGTRRIYVYERGSQFDLLTEVKNTFMWVSPMPERALKRFGLVMKRCSEASRQYADVLIYPQTYKLTEQDRRFISCLYKARDEVALTLITI